MSDRSICISLTERELEYFGRKGKKSIWQLVQSEVQKGIGSLDELPEASEEVPIRIQKRVRVIDFPVRTWRDIVRISGKMHLTPTQFVHRLLIASHFQDMLSEAISDVNSSSK